MYNLPFPEALKKKLEQAEVLVTSPADLTRMMDYIPNVKWVQLTYAGKGPGLIRPMVATNCMKNREYPWFLY